MKQRINAMHRIPERKIISNKSAGQTGSKNYRHVVYTNEMRLEELTHAETISKMIGAENAPEDKHVRVQIQTWKVGGAIVEQL